MKTRMELLILMLVTLKKFEKNTNSSKSKRKDSDSIKDFLKEKAILHFQPIFIDLIPVYLSVLNHIF